MPSTRSTLNEHGVLEIADDNQDEVVLMDGDLTARDDPPFVSLRASSPSAGECVLVDLTRDDVAALARWCLARLHTS